MIPIPRHSDLIALGWPQGNDIYTDMISVIPVCNQQREREDKKQVHDSQFFFVFLEEQWDWEDQLDDHIVLRIPFETRIPNFLVRNLALNHFLPQYSAIQEQEKPSLGVSMFGLWCTGLGKCCESASDTVFLFEMCGYGFKVGWGIKGSQGTADKLDVKQLSSILMRVKNRFCVKIGWG